MDNNKKVKTPGVQRVFLPRAAAEPFMQVSPRTVSSKKFWRWGDDNLFPDALAAMARRSTTHRRILNDKADYISGRGFNMGDRLPALLAFTERANGNGETLRHVLRKVAFDKLLFGNAFLEVVTDEARSFLSFFHQDSSRCRLAKESRHVLLHHDWERFKEEEARQLPLYPEFEKGGDRNLHSAVHFKDYEPAFEHYGVPPYIAGLNVSAIAYKTDKWNISRLDNSFHLSGVMMLDGGVDNEEQAGEIVKLAEKKFSGNPGQVMFMLKDCEGNDNSRFIPITSSYEGDWKSLHEQATGDIVVAHSWFRSLSGLQYSSGFDTKRIVQEYEVALNTVILSAQAEILEPLKNIMRDILRCDCSSLIIVNKPPTRTRPAYMKVWEARQADGLDFDPESPAEQIFVAQLNDYGVESEMN